MSEIKIYDEVGSITIEDDGHMVWLCVSRDGGDFTGCHLAPKQARRAAELLAYSADLAIAESDNDTLEDVL